MKISTNDSVNQRKPIYAWGKMLASGISPYQTISQLKTNYGITYNKFCITSVAGNTINCKRYSDGTTYSGFCAIVDGNKITLFNNDGTIINDMYYIYSAPYRCNIMELK